MYTKENKSILDEQLTIEQAYELYSSLTEHNWTTGASYIRVSTNDQAKFSPESQIKEIFKYALDHQIIIPKEYIFRDDGKSASKNLEKRKNFLKMIDTAKQKPKPFEVVLVYNFSRFARTREDSVYYKAKLRKELKIDVISIKQELPKDNSRVLIESMYEGQDEYYSLNLAEESKRGKKEKVQRGEWLGRAPYGYIFNRNTQTLEIAPEKAETVRFMFQTFYEMQNKGIKKLCIKLNDLKIPSPNGKLWGAKSIKRILRNPAYIGLIRYCDGGFKFNYDKTDIITYKGLHPSIIDEKLFNEVQKEMIKLKEINKKYEKPNPKHLHWLRGILKCSNCGKTLVRIKVKTVKNAWFQCTGYTKGFCKISHHVTEPVVVNTILEQIKKDYTNKLNINIVEKEEEIDFEIQMIEKEIKKYKEKLKRIISAYQNGVDSLKEYKENKTKANNDLENLQSKLKKLKNDIPYRQKKEAVYKKSATAYKILTDEKTSIDIKCQIARDLLEKVIFNKKEKKLIIYYKK